jgi:Uma2 family endonuclease
MGPHRPPHAAAVARAAALLSEAFGSGHHARAQLPLILDTRGEPEPDVVIAEGTQFDYATSHPTAANVRLLLEVSDTTLRLDRGRKRGAYARAGIQEYWILNLPARQLEVHRDPSGPRYRDTAIFPETAAVAPLAAPDVPIRVADLLPPPLVSGSE